MIWIIIILILVHWCLFKVIKDFKILHFTRGWFLNNVLFGQNMFSGLIEIVCWNDYFFSPRSDWVWSNLALFRAHLYDFCITSHFFKNRTYLDWFCNKILEVLQTIVASYHGNRRVITSFKRNLYLKSSMGSLHKHISFDGSFLFDQETDLLIDTTYIDSKTGWRPSIIDKDGSYVMDIKWEKDKDDNYILLTKLEEGWQVVWVQNCEGVPSVDNSKANPYVRMILGRGHLFFNRYYNNMSSHNLTQYMFYNGRLHERKYTRRRAKSLYNTSLFGILEILSVYKSSETSIIRRINTINSRLRNPNKFIVNDIFFQSQNFKHSGLFEPVWAIYPSYIIITILIPSLYLLYSLDDELDPDPTVKVIGHQWYWSYEFDNWIEVSPDVYDFVSYKYNSNIVSIDDLERGTKRLLEVDKRLVLPINFTIRFVITSSDVLHSWAVPSLGIKSDAVPGRLNQFLAFITYPGVYYGQCSELCGAAHGFMPIVVQGVSYQVFVTWSKESNFCQ